MSIVTYENVDTPVFEIDYLRYLFTNGAQGALWGPLPYYSDSAGTVVADWGDPVGFIPDASGNGNDWTQVTSTARPILGRVPVGGRRNLLTDTEGGIEGNWAFNGSGVNSAGMEMVPGEAGVIRLYQQGESGVYISRLPNFPGEFTRSIYVKADGYNFARIGRSPSSNASGAIRLNLITGELTENTSTGSGLTGYGAEAVGNGWWRLWAGYDTETTNSRLTIAATDYIGNRDHGWAEEGHVPAPGEGILIAYPQVEAGSVVTPYQRVGNEYDITEAGVRGIHYLRFDGTDDTVTTTLPAISGGTIVLAGTNGIWIDSLDFAGGAFSVGPDAYTGGPAGLMSILGDLLVEGGFVIDRALTPEEIAKAEKYYKARGAAGLFELGPEMLINGTFDTDLDGWNNSAEWFWDNGAASIAAASSATVYLRQPNTGMLANEVYIVERDLISSSGQSLEVRLGSSATPGGTSSTALLGRVRHILTRTGITDEFFVRFTVAGSSGRVDSVSLRKLELAP